MKIPASRARRDFEQRPPTAGLFVVSGACARWVLRAGLRAREGLAGRRPASITFPCRGTVDLTLRSLTVAGAAPD